MAAAIAGLFVHPVKSCRGISVPSAKVSVRGLEHDREWMVVDADGRFISQREEPKLALIRTALAPGSLELWTQDQDPLSIAFDLAGLARVVSVWRDTLPAIDQGDAAARWLSAHLGREVRLVRFDPAQHRPCNPQYSGNSGAQTAFADGYPLLVLSEASLADLNERLRLPLPANRFRPNLLVSDLDAYAEDYMAELAIGDVLLKPVKPCTRCQIPTIDQETAQIGPEPTVTLAKFRMNEALGGVTFGMNAIVMGGAGQRISVGERVHCTLSF